MKHEYLVRMGSFRALEAQLEKMETSNVPGLADALATFSHAIRSADEKRQRQARPSGPVLERRNAAFRALAVVTLRVAGLAVSHAARQGDRELVAQLELRPRELTFGAYERRLAKARGLLERIAPVQGELAEAGITPTVIAEVEAAIAVAREQMPEPRNHMVGRMDATAALAEQFSELSAIVRLQLDPLFHHLRLTQPALFRQYRAARRRINRPATLARESEEETTGSPAGSTPETSLQSGASAGTEVKAAA